LTYGQATLLRCKFKFIYDFFLLYMARDISYTANRARVPLVAHSNAILNETNQARDKT